MLVRATDMCFSCHSEPKPLSQLHSISRDVRREGWGVDVAGAA